MSTIPIAAVAAPLRKPWRLPLIAALALAFISLALISGVAYTVVLADATGTAERLLVDRAARVVDAQVALLRSRLDPVTEHLELVAALIAHGRLNIESPITIREALALMMGRVPAVSTAAFTSFDLQLHRAQRQPDGLMTRRATPSGARCSGASPSNSRCSMCAHRCGAPTMPSSAA